MSTLPINCFLIDDDKEDQEIFCMALEGVKEHVNCIFAINAEEAFKMLENEFLIPDYIFIDMNMPRLDGNEILKKIKTIKRLNDVPVYLYSTYANPNTISKSKELGAAGFIVKPPKVSELTETLKFIFHDKKREEKII
jgi:response regulator RpfG family c-di-GMP phosphodiesterase